MHNRYILASSSQSRYKILKNAGFNFKQITPDCDETKIKHEMKKRKKNAADIAKKLSYEKAKSVSVKKQYYKNLVIGCDTLIDLDGKILDKANSISQAINKIKKLSGKKHKIISGITICLGKKKIWQSSEITIVKIKKLTKKQIEEYLKKSGKSILSSVGCYQIESLGPMIIEDIRGDFFNVMGLPLFKLLKHISKIK